MTGAYFLGHPVAHSVVL